MKASELISMWGAPDNSRLTSKQFSFRLPVHVAAKLAALVEMYPKKTRTEIVGDLLGKAIEEVISELPCHDGKELFKLPSGEVIYDEAGPIRDFKLKANKHYAELEKEMGNEEPPKLYEITQTTVYGLTT